MNSDHAEKCKPLALRPVPAYRADVRILHTLAVLLAAALAHKEISELCKDADECESDDCTPLGSPGAERLRLPIAPPPCSAAKPVLAFNPSLV